ncbi:hypothetical protein NL676_039642 [Syzygium grande]|nr:hypothetical protein NL676_039642 [Syzygium grande]
MYYCLLILQDNTWPWTEQLEGLPSIKGEDLSNFVRLHFCDIASIFLELLYFNVYVNGFLVFENFDLSSVVNEVLVAPFYADFVVEIDDSGILSVSIGPSNYSMAHAIDGILNGVEVMKLNNSMGSLDGEEDNWGKPHCGMDQIADRYYNILIILPDLKAL